MGNDSIMDTGQTAVVNEKLKNMDGKLDDLKQSIRTVTDKLDIKTQHDQDILIRVDRLEGKVALIWIGVGTAITLAVASFWNALVKLIFR